MGRGADDIKHELSYKLITGTRWRDANDRNSGRAQEPGWSVSRNFKVLAARGEKYFTEQEGLEAGREIDGVW